METLILREDKLRPVLNRHPWIFSGAVKSRPRNPEETLVELRSEKGLLLGYGFYEHSAQLLCKVFHFGEAPDAGFGKEYWNGKLLLARQLRASVLDFSQTDTWRLCHAEGDGIPGLVADVYGGSCLSFQTTIPATLGMLEMWKEIFLDMGFKYLFHSHGKEAGEWLTASPAGPVLCTEHGMKFWNDPQTGQKTGFFIDQRENRRIIGQLSKGRRVLNAFAYTGGFSVYALAAGATEVISVDISKEACRLAEENVSLNFPSTDAHRAQAADCFSYLREMPADFDLIILDPPAFAKNRAAVSKAARGYKEINLQAMKKIRPGGILATFSCSQHMDRDLFQKVIFAAALDAGRNVRMLQFLGQPADHPVSIFHPEGEYLKGLLLQVE